MKTWSAVAKVVAVAWAGALMGGFVYVRAGGVVWPVADQPSVQRPAVMPSSKWAGVYPDVSASSTRTYPPPTASPNPAVPHFVPSYYSPAPSTQADAQATADVPQAPTSAPPPPVKPVRSALMYSSKSAPVFASGDGPPPQPPPPSPQQYAKPRAANSRPLNPPPDYTTNAPNPRPPRTSVLPSSKSAAVIGSSPPPPAAPDPPAQSVQQPSSPQSLRPPQPPHFIYPKSGTWPVQQQAVPQTNQPQWQR